MRHLFLLIPVILLSLCGQSQTLFTYGGKPVTTTTFKQAFNRNPGQGSRAKAMEEYLPLYIKYILKVQDAYDQKLDTLPNQMAELNGYRQQLAENYLSEKAGIEEITKEAVKRLQEEVLLGHIFIAYNTPDSHTAKQKSQDAYKALKAGKSWQQTALAFSTDAEVTMHKGEPGWITAFTLPYPFENEIYALAKGGFTQPIAASEGYHIFSKRNTRAARGTVEVAQIHLARMSSASAADLANSQKLADSLYQLLRAGADFTDLVRRFSQDRSTNQQGGKLPPISTGTYHPSFEDQAFALQRAGDISKPFQTSFGTHILQLVARNPAPSATNTTDLAVVKQQVLNAGRLEFAKTNLVEKNLVKAGYKGPLLSFDVLKTYTDSAVTKSGYIAGNLTPETALLKIGNTSYTLADWLAWYRVQVNARQPVGTDMEPLYQKFKQSKGTEYLKENLEKLEPDFAAQMKEFRDANMLFEAMEQQVWTKAAMDTEGLKDYYEKHRDQYVWGPSAQAILVSGTDSISMVAARNKLAENISAWPTLNIDYSNSLAADSGRFELSMLPLADNQNTKAGTLTAITKNEADESFSFVYIIKPEAEGSPRSFDEARGFIVSDYQQVLEDRWVENLKKKYPVKVNEAVWKQLLRE